MFRVPAPEQMFGSGFACHRICVSFYSMTNHANLSNAILSNTVVGTETTVTVVRQNGRIWTVVATSDGVDLLISPTGETFDGSHMSCPDDALAVMETIANNV